MIVAAIDDEKPALENLMLKFHKISKIKKSSGFQSSEKFLSYLEEENVNVAFLDINMGQINGLQLAKRVKEVSPHTDVIFVTGYSEYAVDAFQIHAAGYLMKPVSVSSIEAELEYIQKQGNLVKQDVGLRVQCFGNFEVFFDGKPWRFKRAKTKELLAYLIDRNGASCNVGMLCGILWEDEDTSASKKSQLRTSISELSAEFEKHGLSDVLVKGWNSYAINPQLIQCDYYQYLKMDPQAVNQYQGEYMTQYQWSELTLGTIEKEK